MPFHKPKRESIDLIPAVSPQESRIHLKISMDLYIDWNEEFAGKYFQDYSHIFRAYSKKEHLKSALLQSIASEIYNGTSFDINKIDLDPSSVVSSECEKIYTEYQARKDKEEADKDEAEALKMFEDAKKMLERAKELKAKSNKV